MITSYPRVRVQVTSERHTTPSRVLEQTRCSVWLTAHLVSQASVHTPCSKHRAATKHRLNHVLSFRFSSSLELSCWHAHTPDLMLDTNFLVTTILVVIALLAGRIFLKDFHYHSSNQTFKIVKVELRWQYWVRSLARSEDLQAHDGGEEPKRAHSLSSFFIP